MWKLPYGALLMPVVTKVAQRLFAFQQIALFHFQRLVFRIVNGPFTKERKFACWMPPPIVLLKHIATAQALPRMAVLEIVWKLVVTPVRDYRTSQMELHAAVHPLQWT